MPLRLDGDLFFLFFGAAAAPPSPSPSHCPKCRVPNADKAISTARSEVDTTSIGNIWDTRMRTLPHCLLADLDKRCQVYSVTYSPDGKHLASGGTDGTVKIWVAATGELTQTCGQTSGILAPHYIA